MFKNLLFICLTLLLSTAPVFAFDSKSEMAKVNKKQVLEDVYALIDSEGVRLISLTVQ